MTENMVNGFNISGVPIPYNYDSLGNKLEKTSIAREYSNIDTYNVDEYVIHNGRMYRCKQKILIGESFDSTKWDECSVGLELNYIKQILHQIIEGGSSGEVTPSSIVIATSLMTEEQKSQTKENLEILDELPAVTTVDNGKFMRVEDGVWTAAAVPAAETTSF